MKIPHSLVSSLLIASAHAGGPQQMFFGLALDPGTRGETFTSRILSFSDIDGVSADGVGLELDFNFTVDEQLSFSDTGNDGFDIVLEIDYSDAPGSLMQIPDASVKIFPAFEAHGVPTGSSVSVNGNTVTYTAHFEDEEGFFFNSLRYNALDPFIAGGTITGASVEFVASGPGGSFEVTTPQAPGAVLVDGFTGTVGNWFPLEDDDLFGPAGATESDVPGSAAYERNSQIFLVSGTSMTADVDPSGSGSMDFTVAPASSGNFDVRYSMGRHDITHGGINDQLVIDVDGLSSLFVRLRDAESNEVYATVPIVGNRAVIPLLLSSFEDPPPSFHFTRVTEIRIETPVALGPGTYSLEQIAVTSTAGPQVLSIEPDSVGPVFGAAGMNYTVLFSEPVTEFSNIFDIDTVTTNISGSPAPSMISSADNLTYTFTLRPSIVDGQSSGTLVVSIDPAGGIIDDEGNGLVDPGPQSELVTFSATAYQQWAIDEGLTPEVNFGYSQDPDQDGRINGAEFVRNTSALDADDPQREFFHISESEGVRFGILTVASRTDRTYSEIDDGWLQSDFSGGMNGSVVDVSDSIRATDDLTFDRFTSPPIILDLEVPEPPGLPALDDGWSWYHFRFESSTDALNKGFMRTEIVDND
ncbi:hypothetical protein [Haloferula sp.]|uniref:hypothetical protein n=1 Tax=Haloferula sp. TaxID=2497595 RepID=UPI00329AD440